MDTTPKTRTGTTTTDQTWLLNGDGSVEAMPSTDDFASFPVGEDRRPVERFVEEDWDEDDEEWFYD